MIAGAKELSMNFLQYEFANQKRQTNMQQNAVLTVVTEVLSKLLVSAAQPNQMATTYGSRPSWGALT